MNKNFITNKYSQGKRSGYALLELLFYISLFAVLSVVVINAMIIMSKSFKETTIKAEIIQSGSILERISREVRGAYDIGSVSSTDLVLDTKDSGGANKTVEFVLSGSNLQLLENSTLTGNLNTPSIAITGLTFSQISTAKGKAIRIILTVKSTNDAQARTQDFYDTVVLRGSYQ